MRLVAAFLLAAMLLPAANLNTQSGQSIPAGNWTKATGTTGYVPLFIGFDKIHYTPVLDRMCMWTRNPYDIGTENDTSFNCFSFTENNFIQSYSGGLAHDEHGCAGHAEGQLNIDPTTSQFYGLNCADGTQGGADIAWISSYWFDTITGLGKNKLSTNAPPFAVKEGNGYVDPVQHVMVMYGGGGTEATDIYSLNTNTWTVGATTTGTPPPAGIHQVSVFYRTVDGKGYFFGGDSAGVGTNNVYSYQASTSVWSLITVNGTKPATRDSASIAYDAYDDAALLFGGYDTETNQNTKFDTWLLDFSGVLSARLGLTCSAPCWNQLAPATSPSSAAVSGATFFRMAWLPTHNVFVLYNLSTLPAREVWFYRFDAGDNLGSNALTPSSAYPYTSGSLNRNPPSATGVAAVPPTPTQGMAMVGSGVNYYQIHAEGGGTSDTSNAATLSIYADQNASTQLPNPSLYNSLVPDPGGQVESYDPAITISGGIPYAAWSTAQPGGNFLPEIYVKSYSAGAWSGGIIGWGTECPGVHNACQQELPSIADAGGTPTLAYIQSTTVNVTEGQNLAFVKQFSGGVWSLLGTAPLNVGYTGTTSRTGADSISVAGDGTTNPWVAWTEHTLTSSAVSTNAKVYLARWSGTAWVMQCSGAAANVDGTNGWAGPVSLTMIGTTPYVGFTERGSFNGNLSAGAAQGYVRTCSGPAGVWSTIGGGAVNRDTQNGWVYRMALTNDGTNLYVAFNETGNLNAYGSQQTGSAMYPGYSQIGQYAYLEVDKWAGSGNWVPLGGALNANNQGSVTRPAIAMVSGNPTAGWGETVFGSYRQIYARSWNGTDWSTFATSASVSPTSIPTETVGQVVSITLTGSGFSSGPTWSLLTGTQPTGMGGTCITGTTASTCLLSGTIGSSAGSPYSFTIRATDGTNTVDTPFTVTVNAVPAITTSSPLPNATQGVSYSDTLTISGGTSPVTCAITSGTLLGSGMTLSSTCQISGTGGTAGLYSISVTPTDTNNIAGSAKPLTLTVLSSSPTGGSVIGGTLVLSGKTVRD